jgi:hypothetical protein
MTNITGLLFEVVSIQKYVFGGSRFRYNAGASYIISELLYKDWLLEDVANGFGIGRDDPGLFFSQWQKDPKNIAIKEDKCKAEIVWVAGGTACLLLKGDKDFARKIVQCFSARLLVRAPGLKLCAAIKEVCMESLEHNFGKWIKDIFTENRKIRERGLPICSFPNPGVSLPCSQTGATAETKLKNDWVSAEIGAKYNVFEKANKKLKEKYLNQNCKYDFPLDFGDMGQKKGEKNHIAIVHVDGDAIGEIFHSVESVEQCRQLSGVLRDIFEEAFRRICLLSISIMESVTKEQENQEEKEFCFKDNILPLRPLLIGGDDITFVAEGRLGIYFAIRYLMELRSLVKAQKTIDSEAFKNFTASAAVAITGTKFPFWQGYQLAEEVCSQAKQFSKKLREYKKYEWCIDFHISRGTDTTDFKHMRHHHFTSPQGSLLYRPVTLDGQSSGKLNMIQLMEAVIKISEWPNSVVHGLRDVLYRSKEVEQEFLQQQELQGRKLKDLGLGNPFDKMLFGGTELCTPYIDIIELLDFLPPEPIPGLLLPKLKGEVK